MRIKNDPHAQIGIVTEESSGPSGPGVSLWSAGPVGLILLWRHAVITDPLTLTLGFTVIGTFSASALLLAVLPGTSKLWKRFLNGGVLKQFGKYSYGLYMLHMPVSDWMHQHHWVLKAANRRADLFYLVLKMATSFLVALVSFHCFEKHFLKLKRFFEPGQRASQVEHPGQMEVCIPAHRQPVVQHTQVQQ